MKNASKLTDFGDWISPMIVRELRQGMRTRMFTAVFILMLAYLVITLLAGLAASMEDAEVSTRGFWLCVGFVFLFVMPLRGFSAIAGEEKRQTMDLLKITRLPAGKIIFGKWAALFSQTLLLTSLLLPFVVLRYFTGGLDLIAEGYYLLSLLVLSGTFTAFVVGLSTQRSIVLRCLVIVAAIYVVLLAARRGLISMVFGGSGIAAFSGGVTSFLPFLLKYLVICGFASYFVLALGASQFAPASENHAMRKRLVAIFYVVLVALLSLFVDVSECLLVLIVPVIDALTERPAPTAGVCMAFMKKRKLFRMWRWMLYPGWQSGMIFLGVLVLLCLLIYLPVYFMDHEISVRSTAYISAYAGALLFPAAMVWFFSPGAGSPLGRYFVISLLSCLACLLVGNFGDEVFLLLLFPIPMSLVILLQSKSNFADSSEILFLSVITTGCWLALLICRMIPVIKQFRAVERECEALLEKEGGDFESSK